MKTRKLRQSYLTAYLTYLLEEEKSEATIRKYAHDIRTFYSFLGNQTEVDKTCVVNYKEYLKQHYKTTSINSMIVALNRFFVFLGWEECRVKELKIQKRVFSSTSEELSEEEYQRLLEAAKNRKNNRLMMLMQAICATGIRVSEHRFITVEALKNGYMVISNKGKIREVHFPEKLRSSLIKYCYQHKITHGCVFVTRNGKAMDRSNIWSMMKSLCETANVDRKKVYPHNLRHLFAITYYQLEKDIIHLADILGHSSIETTRIYIRTSSRECQRVFNRMNLACMRI